MKKRPKFIVAAYLFVQSLCFFIAFLANAKKKNTTATFCAAIAGLGTIGGAILMYLDYLECKANHVIDDFDEIDEDFCDLDTNEDDIVCSFEDELPEEEN